MITIAVHNSTALQDGDVRKTIVGLAEDLQIVEPGFFEFTTAIDFVEKAASNDGHAIDLVILPYELAGISGVQAVIEARGTLPKLKAIIISDSADGAAEAAACNIDGFLTAPIKVDDFKRTVGNLLQEIDQLHGGSILVSSRGTAVRVEHDEILYCETSGHDQIVHLIGGASIAGRYSSQAMFELLRDDPRFFKAGSSYIVNLHEITESRSNNTVLLSDGTTLSVPARLRKSLEVALLAL